MKFHNFRSFSSKLETGVVILGTFSKYCFSALHELLFKEAYLKDIKKFVFINFVSITLHFS